MPIRYDSKKYILCAITYYILYWWIQNGNDLATRILNIWGHFFFRYIFSLRVKLSQTTKIPHKAKSSVGRGNWFLMFPKLWAYGLITDVCCVTPIQLWYRIMQRVALTEPLWDDSIWWLVKWCIPHIKSFTHFSWSRIKNPGSLV